MPLHWEGVEQCGDCGLVRCAYNSCRNRHCLKCQGLARAEWLEARQAELFAGALLPRGLHPTTAGGGDRVPEQARGLRHPVPRCGRSDARHRRRSRAFRRRDRRGRPAPHLGANPAAPPASALHCPRRWPPPAQMKLDGWLAGRGSSCRFASSRDGSALCSLRGRRVALLRHTRDPGRAAPPSPGVSMRCVRSSMPSARSPDPSRCSPISAAIPIASPSQTLCSTRLADGQVHFTWKDYRQHGKTKVMMLAADEFIRRFLQQCGAGDHCIRHIGFLANGHRTAKLALCRALLAAPTPRSAAAGELPRAHPPSDRPSTPRLPALWRRDAGARTAAAPSTAAATCSGATAHDQDQSRPTNQSELRRRCPHRHGPAQADDGQFDLCPVGPLGPTHHPEAITAVRQANCAFTTNQPTPHQRSGVLRAQRLPTKHP